MNWKDEPATENQLGHLRRLGYEPEGPLTKGEAAQLIDDFEAGPTRRIPLVENRPSDVTNVSAYQFRLTVEAAKQAIAAPGGGESQSCRHALEAALAERLEFWADTCSDADKMHLVSTQVLTLYKKHGCRFAIPTAEQVQVILDTLDAALPMWDREHPELFYETLELNFPQLLRHQHHA